MLEDEKGPGEPDPEADLPDYEEELAPSVRIPEPPVPEATAQGTVPSEVQRRFWTLVMAFNAALLAGSLGAMFVVFRGNWTTGGRLLLAGSICFAYGVYRLRTWDVSGSSDDGDENENEDEVEGDGGDEASDAGGEAESNTDDVDRADDAFDGTVGDDALDDDAFSGTGDDDND